MLIRFLDRLTRKLPMRGEVLAARFSRNLGETTSYAVAFIAFGGIAECDLYEVETKSVEDGVVRFAVDRQRRSGDVDKVLSTLGFPTEEVEIPLRDGDSARSVVEMAVALVHFRARPDDLAVIGEVASGHPLAVAQAAVERRMGGGPFPSSSA